MTWSDAARQAAAAARRRSGSSAQVRNTPQAQKPAPKTGGIYEHGRHRDSAGSRATQSALSQNRASARRRGGGIYGSTGRHKNP